MEELFIQHPVPWVVDDNRPGLNAGLITVYDASGTAVLATGDMESCTYDDILLAHLVAAAPALLEACKALVEAVARARKADDNVYRAATDPSKALFDEQEDAHATLIICENEARAAIDAAEGEGERSESVTTR